MRIDLIKENGKTIGWDFVAESTDDKYTLNEIRNMQFFGYDDTRMVYDGREGNDEFVERLRYRQYKHRHHH